MIETRAAPHISDDALEHLFVLPHGRLGDISPGGDCHQRPSPRRLMTHSWFPLSSISARDLPIAWCSGSWVKTWTKTSRQEIVVGGVSICHRWTAVVLRYSWKPGSGKLNVTPRRRNRPPLARETKATARRGTSDRRK